ncbi:hypothetical protein HDV05_001082 [Chytridiales sp. JEL 0842]|nr:hypothetical protein HDV05_001082 [Chytridiales sp. JEL 0842]
MPAQAAPPAKEDPKERNAVFHDRIQEETVRKEMRVHKPYENYMLTPGIKKNLIVDNKPQSMSIGNQELEDGNFI